MSAKKCILVLLPILLSFLFLSVEPLCAQQVNLQKKISGSFNNVSLDYALRKIASQANVKFSYNPELIQSSRRVTFHYSRQTLQEVLKQIINDPSVSYREMGNQIVLFRPDDAVAKTETTKIISPDKVVLPTKKNPDTVYVYRSDTLTYLRRDTVYKTNTVLRTDTLRLVDTVFIEKHKTQEAGQNLKNPFENNSLKRQKFFENNGFFTGIYFGTLPGQIKFEKTDNPEYYSLMKQAVSSGSRNYTLGVFAGYDYYKVGIYTGLGFLRSNEHFEYSFIKETGGFYKTDTVETYYTLLNSDTTWYYLTDSSWIQKETNQFDYKNQNTYTYLDIPLNLKFRFYQSGSFSLYALAGMNAQILLNSNALYIDPKGSHEASWIDKGSLSTVLLSWNAGLGTSIRLGNSMGILAETTYRQQLTNQYTELPVKKTVSMFTAKAGVFMNF